MSNNYYKDFLSRWSLLCQKTYLQQKYYLTTFFILFSNILIIYIVSGDIVEDSSLEPKVTYDLIEGHLPPPHPGLTVLPGLYPGPPLSNKIRSVKYK